MDDTHRRAPAGRSWRRIVIIAGVVTAVGVVGWAERRVVLTAMARVLIAEDTLASIDTAVISLTTPRAAAFEAARLYREGVVQHLAVFTEAEAPLDQAVRDLGIAQLNGNEIAVAIAERLDVPRGAIEVLPGPVDGTGAETAAIARLVRGRGVSSVLLITSRSHSARARWLLAHRLPAGTGFAVRAPRDDGFDAATWWHSREDAREVAFEYLRWINTLLLRDAWATTQVAGVRSRAEAP